MPGQLPRIGSVSYNGYNWPQAFEARVEGTPIYTSDNRTSKMTSYVFHLTWYVVYGDIIGGLTVDNHMRSVRACLMEVGGRFVFEQQGFGLVDTANFRKDVAFGPSPRSFSWRSAGSNYAAQISWSVEVHLPECCEVTPAVEGQPMEWTFEANYSIDHQGMTTRTITGTLEIPMTRVGHNIPDIVDLYRDRLQGLQRPENFRRTQNYHISRDKRSLSFTITDSEINSNNAYPKGVTDVDVRFEVSREPMQIFTGRLGKGNFGVGLGLHIPGVFWHVNLHGSFRLVEGATWKDAYEAFIAIRDDRISQAVAGEIVAGGGIVGNIGKALTTLRQSFSEGIYDRSLSFSETMIMPMFLSTIMKIMWRKVPAANNKWDAWGTSMVKAFGLRGVAGLQSYTTDDVIVDLCQDGNPSMGEGTPARITNVPQGTDDAIDGGPSARASYLHHDLQFKFRRRHNRLRHQLYQENLNQMAPGTPLQYMQDATGGLKFEDSIHTLPDIIQECGASSYDVEMHGSAIRVGYGIPTRHLRSVIGQQAIEIADDSHTAVVSHAQVDGKAVPIFYAEWHKLYYLKNTPGAGDIGPPENYVAGGGDTDNAALIWT